MADNQKDQSIIVEEAVTRAEMFIVQNKNKIIGVIAAIVIIVAGIVSYQKLYAEPREHKAQVAMIRSERLFEEDMFSDALNGDSISVGFLKIISQYSGTDAANLSKYYAGICYAQTGEYQKAIDMLDSFKSSDAMVGPAAKGAMGNCYIQLGQIGKGIEMLEKAAKQADDNSLSPIYLLQAGQANIHEGNYQKALEDFTTIKEKYFQSYQSLDIDRYIEQAQQLVSQK